MGVDKWGNDVNPNDLRGLSEMGDFGWPQDIGVGGDFVKEKNIF